METRIDRFVFLPSLMGSGVLVRRDQIVGARPNGPNEGSILYTEAGPSIYRFDYRSVGEPRFGRANRAHLIHLRRQRKRAR